LPFRIQDPKDVVKEYAIVASKIKKPFVSIHKVGDAYLLYVVDDKKLNPKACMIGFCNDGVHIYDCEQRNLLKRKQIQELLGQVREFSKVSPLCSRSNKDHIEPIISPKKEIYLKRITKVLEYAFNHAKEPPSLLNATTGFGHQENPVETHNKKENLKSL